MIQKSHGVAWRVLSSRVDARGPIDDEKIATIAIGRVASTRCRSRRRRDDARARDDRHGRWWWRRVLVEDYGTQGTRATRERGV